MKSAGGEKACKILREIQLLFAAFYIDSHPDDMRYDAAVENLFKRAQSVAAVKGIELRIIVVRVCVKYLHMPPRVF